MAGKPQLYPGQKTKKVGFIVSEDMHDQLRELAMSFGLLPSTYVRSLVATHLNKLRATEATR